MNGLYLLSFQSRIVFRPFERLFGLSLSLSLSIQMKTFFSQILVPPPIEKFVLFKMVFRPSVWWGSAQLFLNQVVNVSEPHRSPSGLLRLTRWLVVPAVSVSQEASLA